MKKIPLSDATNAHELLNDVCRAMIAEPKRVYMGDWIVQGARHIQNVLQKTGPACSTVGCIAGWTVLLKDGKEGDGGVGSRAADILGMPELNTYPNGLFYQTEGYGAYGTRSYARNVVRAIRKFMAGNKETLLAKAV